MARILTRIGEEWMNKTNLDNETPDVGLYDDSVDDIQDPDNVADITTEPSDGNYSRSAGISVTVQNIDGDYGISNDNDIVIDVSGTGGDVDSYFFVVEFDSEEAGELGDHLVITGALSQSYALDNLDTLTISAGTAGVTVD